MKITRIYVRYSNDKLPEAWVLREGCSITRGMCRSKNFRRTPTWHFGEYMHNLFRLAKEQGLKLERVRSRRATDQEIEDDLRDQIANSGDC